MRSLIRAAALGLAVATTFPLVALTATPAEAQIFRRVKEAAQRAAERETERQVDKAVTETIRCTVGDDACRERAEREGKKVETVDASGNVVSGDAANAAAPGAPSASTAFVNYDFVPGERILVAEDFARDRVGDFPRRLEFVSGNMEVAEWRDGRWLRGTTWPVEFAIDLPEELPERFTLEMEIVPGRAGSNVEIYFSENPEQHVGARYHNDLVNAGITGNSGAVAMGNSKEEVQVGTPFMLRVMADGPYTKVYVNGTRVANVPNSQIGRSKRILIEMPGEDETPAFARNIRIAAGGRDLYDALSAEGRVATQGILFDTGSDRIRPESAPTLEEIGNMLKEHADLRLSIEGHTDDVGDDAANLALSERRAAAVKAHLERAFGIAADRLQAKGMGETKPAAGNDTPEGRQQNRRVELVKQ